MARKVRAGEIETALRLILSPPGHLIESRMVRDFAAMATGRGIDLQTIHVADVGGKIASAILPIFSPGKTALLMAPASANVYPADATSSLIEPICRLCRQREVDLAQALLDPLDQGAQKAFESRQFKMLAELLYLQGQPPSQPIFPTLRANQRWVHYAPENHQVFGKTITASYQGSLDCPSLNGLRDADDIIAGHKACGEFSPATWFILTEDQNPLGVLLLNHSSSGDTLELVYVGLMREARGRKLGEVMLQQAMAVAAQQRVERLCLAVDGRNVPALKLYYRHGMQRVGIKNALLRDLRLEPPI